MKQIIWNTKICQFSLVGAMLKGNVLRKFLDYSFIENKVYVRQVETVECVKDEIKAMIYHSKGFRLRFWDTNYTNVLKYKRFFLSCFYHNYLKLKPKRYPVTIFLSPTFSAVVHYKVFSLRRQNTAHKHN